MTRLLSPPHGGVLVDLMSSAARRTELRTASRDWPSWDLTPRQLCDLELLLCGGMSPLRTFMGRADYDAVKERGRLAEGTLWPIPVTLDVDAATVERLETEPMLALRDIEGVMLASMAVDEVWELDAERHAEAVYGTISRDHPGVEHIFERENRFAVSGRIEGVERPHHYDFASFRATPAELRRWFEKNGWRRIVAFQTRNPMHRAHYEMTLRAAHFADANLLLHPVVGQTRPGDLDHYTRVRCYRAILGRYPRPTVKLALLPLAMRMAGPREALWHAIIRKNYGCSHFIVGRDHAGPGVDSDGKPFYGPYDAQELVARHQDELGVAMVPFQHVQYVPDRDLYLPADEIEEGTRTLQISGTGLRRRLADGRDLPEWFTFPEVAEELRRRHPPRHRRGVTVFFTGLSGAGKSTIARAVMTKLLELGDRPVTLLDGDVVRTHLSSELGFSREHRDLNIQRIGFVASEITKNRGIAICAPIAPYDRTRRRVRRMIEEHGGFFLVHVATPLEVCERRDRKGLYAKARQGIIQQFTGISDPYEEPVDADLVLDTSELTPEETAQEVLRALEREGYLGSSDR